MHHFWGYKTGNSQLLEHHSCHRPLSSSKHTEDSCSSAAGLVVKGKTSTGETQPDTASHQGSMTDSTRDLNADEQNDLILDLLYVEGCSMSWAIVGCSRVVVGW